MEQTLNYLSEWGPYYIGWFVFGFLYQFFNWPKIPMIFNGD